MRTDDPMRRALLFLLALLVIAAALVVAVRALRPAPPADAPDGAGADGETLSDAPPRAASVPEAFALFEGALRRGETSFTFLAEGDWTADELNLLAAALLANSAEIAAETGFYRYEITPLSSGEGAVVCIEAEYRVDQELLMDRNLELRSTLDELAAELGARRGDDPRALYLAAARAVAGRASFDTELARATDTEALTEAQRIERSAYGALVGGETVCTGYAMAFKALCDRLGLPCFVVSGRSGGEHAWNRIVLDGMPLYVDCSSADVLGDESWYFMDDTVLAARGYESSDAALVFPAK